MKFTKSYTPAEFEPQVYALWETTGAFKPNSTAPKAPYSIVMPPPNANGNLHIGHGLTIALEDILTRYHRLNGRPTWYIPGADHAGFETWVVYEKALEKTGHSRFDYSRDELYNHVWSFVAEQRGNMELQLRALGASCDWSALTFTLDTKVVNTVYSTFKRLWDDQLVYRGKKLVNFCTVHQTAFADIEVDHIEEQGTLWDIAYPLVDGSGEVIVSTTRPETMLGDTAVAVHPDDSHYQEFVGKHLRLPLTDREIPVIADTYVDQAFGTGAVKITPAHDQNDFDIGERHHLEQITVIDFDGRMTPAAGQNYEHLTVADARAKVLRDLDAQGLLRGKQPLRHSVGHCYKCGSVIEPLLKEQWFVRVEPLAKRAIQALEAGKIKFHPASKKRVLINYFKQLKDWNISRQIPWGIPIPAFQNVNNPADWVFSTEVDKQSISRGGHTYIRDEDTFDTWFSSGQWPYITTDWLANQNAFYPLDVMETGADILFSWIARMIMLGLYTTDHVPFHDVYLHGLVLDEKGQKMSKSKGNVMNPIELVTQYGSDAFRLGIIANRSAGQNQAFSTASVIAGRNLCNKLWNIARLIQNFVDQHETANEKRGAAGKSGQPSPTQHSSSLHHSRVTTLNMGEDWIVRELETCRHAAATYLKSYRFAEAYETLYDTIWNKYADWFLESQKLYQNVPLLKKTLEHILIMLHPFAPFTTETIWQALSWTWGLCISQNPLGKLSYDPITASEFETLQTIISEVRRALQSLPDGKKHMLTYSTDSIVAENELLIQTLTHVSSINATDDPSGLRVPVPNHELYLDIPQADLDHHRRTLESRIMGLGREIDTLNLRLDQPRYIKKAPKSLVKQTRDQLAEKQALLQKLKDELTLI
jgi:valyl-tRNA synthetase